MSRGETAFNHREGIHYDRSCATALADHAVEKAEERPPTPTTKTTKDYRRTRKNLHTDIEKGQGKQTPFTLAYEKT